MTQRQLGPREVLRSQNEEWWGGGGDVRDATIPPFEDSDIWSSVVELTGWIGGSATICFVSFQHTFLLTFNISAW